ncbi:hypothetical protein EOM09_07585, partial [bacterium]|nr:hypothetical protein [bacterium]
MKKGKNDIEFFLSKNKRNISQIFLGVGFTMFFVNLSSYISVMSYIPIIENLYGISILYSFYASLLSSLFLITKSIIQ